MTTVFFVLLLVLLAGPLAAALLTYAFFWYEAANGPYAAELRSRYGKRLTRVLLGGFLSSYLSSILTVLLYPLGFLRQVRGAQRGAGSTTPHVMLIHGLYHNASAWTLFRRRLAHAGFDSVTAVNYSSFGCTFWELTERMNQEIKELSDTGDRPVIVIGHSLGGLLARACLRDNAGNTATVGVITLGTPHQGSKLAVLGPGCLARSIAFQGPVIQELRQRLAEPDYPLFALHSPVDNMVLPNAALKATEAGWTNVETPPVSHVAMLYHRKTAAMVIDCLRRMCG